MQLEFLGQYPSSRFLRFFVTSLRPFYTNYGRYLASRWELYVGQAKGRSLSPEEKATF